MTRLRAALTATSERATYVENPRLVGSLLVAAALLVGAPGLFHPVLSGDAPTQLAAIAATDAWRLIHLSIAFGHVLAVASTIALSSTLGATSGRSAATLGRALVVLGYGTALVGVVFMLGPAHSLATTFRTSTSHAASSNAAFLYDTLHPFAQAALRVGAFATSCGLFCVGWSIAAAGRAWLGRLAVGAGLIGAVVAVAVSEHSPAIVAGIGLAAIWQLLAGVALLVGEPWTATDAPSPPRGGGAIPKPV